MNILDEYMNAAFDYDRELGAYVDGEEQGTLNEDTVVDYYYKKKEYNITTQVVPNSETGLLGGTITGEYKLFKKSVKLEFLKPIKIGKDLDKENEKFMKIISEKLEKEVKRNVKNQ